MDGTAELLQLIELLRLGAATGRKVADLRGRDREDIYKLCAEAERMAEDLQRIVDRPVPKPN